MAKPARSLRTIRKRAASLVQSGKLKEAYAFYTSACRDYPSDAGLWLALASLDRRLGQFREAEQRARHVLSFHPSDHRALVEYGASVQAQGRIDQAIAAYKKAIDLHPDCRDAHYYLANACLERGLTDLARTHYRKTISIQPDHLESLNNLSAILTNQGKIQEAMELLHQGLKIRPNECRILVNLARAHLFTGNSQSALDILERVIRLHPKDPESHSKYLLCTNYISQPDPDILYLKHKQWGWQHGRSIKRYTKYNNSVDRDKRLRIGYLSPDLKEHSVAYFIEPVLAHHDTCRFRITCYADVANPDRITRRLKSLGHNWRSSAKMSNEQLCEIIRSDQIDILVDLAGHTANNRLMVFARKPAPVSVSYLGYPNTTGLDAIDYRITDSIADPPGIADKHYTEKLIRLTDGFLCYQPPENAPDCSRATDKNPGNIVFCSFNNLAKLTPEVIHAWSQILLATENSRLLLKSKATADSYTCSRLIELFNQRGIDQHRLILHGFTESKTEHLHLYNQVDIALDTFPYNGTTTTCEALWMGVPVITLRGDVHASRVGASLLSRLDLCQFVATTPDEYIHTAIRLASDSDQLVELRCSLRDRMKHSTLLDARLFTKNLEAAYANILCTYHANVS